MNPYTISKPQKENNMLVQQKENVYGSVFIIPNNTSTISDFYSREALEAHFQNLGIEVGEDDELVQLWFTSKDSENWADHGHPTFGNQWVSQLPAKLFENLKEGDHITLSWKGVKVDLALNQRSFRYRRFGAFETVLSTVSK